MKKPRAVAASVDVGNGELLAAAAELFRKVGYEASTTRQLARDLGVRSASLYYHMGKKEDLLYAICISSLEHVQTAVETAIATESDPLERVRVLICTQLEANLAQRDKHQTMLSELKSLSPRRRQKVIEYRDAYEQLVRRVITQAQTAGALRTDIKPKYLTLALLNLLNWTIFWYHPGGPLTIDRLGEILADLFINGAKQQR